jgi:hypothetical protein
MKKNPASSKKLKKNMNRIFFLQKYYTSVKMYILLAVNRPSRYAEKMFLSESFVVFPEGDVQEINGRLALNQLVDLNGKPIVLPLPTNRMIVFRVFKISTDEYKGGNSAYHYLEQVSARELAEYVEK